MEKKVQLKNLVKPLDQMSDDELIERLRTVRHNREVARPVARKRAERSEAKASRGKMSATEKLLAGLSPAEREQLLKQLGDSDGEA